MLHACLFQIHCVVVFFLDLTVTTFADEADCVTHRIADVRLFLMYGAAHYVRE